MHTRVEGYRCCSALTTGHSSPSSRAGRRAHYESTKLISGKVRCSPELTEYLGEYRYLHAQFPYGIVSIDRQHICYDFDMRLELQKISIRRLQK